MQLLLGQVMEISVGPVVAAAMFESFEVGGVEPLGTLGGYLADDFGLSVDHDGVQPVGRPGAVAVVEGGQLVVQRHSDLAPALPHLHKQRPHYIITLNREHQKHIPTQAPENIPTTSTRNIY